MSKNESTLSPVIVVQSAHATDPTVPLLVNGEHAENYSECALTLERLRKHAATRLWSTSNRRICSILLVPSGRRRSTRRSHPYARTTTEVQPTPSYFILKRWSISLKDQRYTPIPTLVMSLYEPTSTDLRLHESRETDYGHLMLRNT